MEKVDGGPPGGIDPGLTAMIKFPLALRARTVRKGLGPASNRAPSPIHKTARVHRGLGRNILEEETVDPDPAVCR